MPPATARKFGNAEELATPLDRDRYVAAENNAFVSNSENQLNSCNGSPAPKWETNPTALAPVARDRMEPGASRC